MAEEEEFYTPANEDTIAARRVILEYSIAKSTEYIEQQRQQQANLDVRNTLVRRRDQKLRLSKFEPANSDIICDRPISRIRVSSIDDNLAILSDWNGSIRLIDSNSLSCLSTLESGSFTGKVSGLSWHPSDNKVLCGDEVGTLALLSIDNTDSNYDIKLVQKFVREEQSTDATRITSCKFHPLSTYAASSSFSCNWSLWDVAKGKELYTQDGHSKPLFDLDFNATGSLISTVGSDSYGFIWDLRSGSKITSLIGHKNYIYKTVWSPNGYQLATSGSDGVIKIWDLRMNRQSTESNDTTHNELSTILAHNKVVSDLQWKNDDFIVSSSFDGCISIISTGDWSLDRIQGGLEKIMSVDTSNDDWKYILTSSWNGEIKKWETSET